MRPAQPCLHRQPRGCRQGGVEHTGAAGSVLGGKALWRGDAELRQKMRQSPNGRVKGMNRTGLRGAEA